LKEQMLLYAYSLPLLVLSIYRVVNPLLSYTDRG
jgi:hypothetical protein